VSVEKKRLSAAERRQQIMRSAIDVFARSNFRVASTSDIARQAGISEPMIYRHFGSKQQLFTAALDDIGARLLRRWQETSERESDPVTALKAIGLDYYDSILDHPDELKVLFQALAEVDEEDVRAALGRQFSAYVESLKVIMEHGKGSGQFRQDLDTSVMAWLFLSVGFTLNLIGLLRLDEDVSRDRLVAMEELFLETVRAHRAPEDG
jgi:AcrR family transcriptional regulator